MPSARRVRWARFRTTVVSLVACAILITLCYLLTGGTLFQRKARIYLYAPDATGIGPGSPVRVDGIGVGKVDSVSLAPPSGDPNRMVRVTVSLETGHLREIPIDSWAQFNAETMVGDRFVDVSSGSSPQRVPPNGEIVYRAQPELMNNLDLQQFDRQLRAMEAVLTDIEQGRGRVGQFMVGTAMYDDTRRRLAVVENAIRRARNSTDTVGRVLYDDAQYARIRNLLVGFDQALARIESGAGSAGTLLRDSAQYDRLQTAAVNLRESAEKIRAGSLMASDQAYLDWNRRLAQWIERVDVINASPAMISAHGYEELNGAAAEFRDIVREFRGNPKKFLRLGLF